MQENKSSLGQFNNGDTVFFVLKNGSYCPTTNLTPSSFYVAGHVSDKHFVPDGRQIIGDGHLAEAGHGMPGWYELGSGNFYPMQTARSPTSPYINGFMTSEGFMPSSREIH